MSLQLPLEPPVGEPVSPRLIAQLIRYVRAITPRQGEGTRLSYHPSGTTIAAARQRTGGGGGTYDPDHPFKVLNASTPTVAKVKIVAGSVLGFVWPTIGGVTISTDPAPLLTVTDTGWVVMTTTWTDDHLPRNIPLTASITFQAGDITANYVPPAADVRTLARMPIGYVLMAGGKITAVGSVLSWNVAMTRVCYGNLAGDVRFEAVRL